MKSADLAIFSGRPAFSEAVHVGRPNIGDPKELHAMLDEILQSRWLSNGGPKVVAFEQRIAEICEVEHCVAMSNGTQALELLIQACGLSGSVIVPSFTFIATIHALQRCGVTPVFADIDSKTQCLDPIGVEPLIDESTTGILPVNIWGEVCAMESFEELSERHDVDLIFDSAHAFGCSHAHTMIGNFGRGEIFSFHATKFVNCFEGGAVCTNEHALADHLRELRNFGITGPDRVEALGTNAKMSEIAAAMGLVSLQAMPSIIETNQRHYASYVAGLGDCEGIEPLAINPAEKRNYQYAVVRVTEDSPLTRDQLLKVLELENVLARRYFYPGCHRMRPYADLYPGVNDRLPETNRLCREVLVLPTGTNLSSADVDRIVAIIRAAIGDAGAVAKRLHSNQL